MWQHETEHSKSPSCQEDKRQQIDRKVKAFLARGGKITVLPAPKVKAPNAYRVSVKGDDL
ncbi:hypothetical protein NX722_13465 [Endozoicomonas gorgoniicola]|uniref:Transcriptional regulator SutA RNAP-binding domain-containing protein n=1 Tax=Endozoicomonas gorgoniicola TaxID=1234144 RepID=A0ABT3MW53_9GAMM|nr:hypothetical protein [Endozoicomonas gorgoniicola]MCW7553616.1 hypothetical protein [Endozoicomonas gorgoniicola]